MGVISRKIFPACGSMCVCCPALRSSSRKPVKRYKKLLAEIFPKSLDGHPNERKIVKLCEYASKNSVRIPKIAKYLEERCEKELRNGHIKFLNVVAETYSKLLFLCKEQMAYFAVSLLNVVTELLDNSKQDAVQMLGCQTLTRFIYAQTDAMYTHNIEGFVQKVCVLARVKGEDHQKRCLRASSLQCLSAMVWFMAEFSHIFADFDEIVHVTLDNYELDTLDEEDNERLESQHNWVDEVVRSEGRIGAILGSDASPCSMIRPRPEKKDPSLLSREETETPKVWAQICIQRMAELSKESTTMRRILDPMFVYFDSGRHWVSQGLALLVLSDMSYFMEASGNQQLTLTYVIRHLDHKNVSHDPELKSYIIQVATGLARQIRSGTMLAEIGFVSDLCWHLRKSLQATIQLAVEQESNSNVNIMLQNSIEDCLLEIAKRIGNAQPLFDLMAITLEKLPSGTVARATIGSLIILAHTISLALVSSRSKQVFPESLLVQLLKVMLHPDLEVRVGAHQIFSILLVPSSNRPRHEVASLRSGFLYQSRRWHSNTASAFASITARLEKLRREKDGSKTEKNGNTFHDDNKEKDIVEEDFKQGRGRKNSPSFYKISSIIDRKPGSIDLNEAEPFVMRLSEDQIVHLLSAFWIQAYLSDNLPSNIESIAHSFILTLISSRLKLNEAFISYKNPTDNLVVNFFQLLLSLRKMSLDPNNGAAGLNPFSFNCEEIRISNDIFLFLIFSWGEPGMLTPAGQRSVLVLSMSMLMFAAKIYHIPELNDFLKSLIPYDLEAEDVLKQLQEPFTPDDTFSFGPQSALDLDHDQMASHSKESLSFDGDFPTNSLVEDDATSELSVADLSRFIPRVPSTSSGSHIISIGQLLESALEVAGHVAGSSVSTSPLPYNAMASQCEALGTGTRKKLSNWLAHENYHGKAAEKSFPAFPFNNSRRTLHQITSECEGESSAPGQGAAFPQDPWLSMRLPPASPFDNFLKAAGC
ncbi:hypothetical protein G4B88_011168 [Cannabis sativa]|uniref:Uncharacterized protein n=1 Tax=Cannabis sativa TaxID=3483 RepID=A0A7J6E6E1_CANSA|nr:hypothetical protein G4B88_011168 [Cannabis sativa]